MQIRNTEVKQDRVKRITFKKRRIGLVKKAIQISSLTGCLVELKIYNQEDESLLEYYTNSDNDFDGISKSNQNIKEYVKFYKKHDNLISRIHDCVTQHGTIIGQSRYSSEINDEFHKQICQELDHKDLVSMFSLSKSQTKLNTQLSKRPSQNLGLFDDMNKITEPNCNQLQQSDFFKKYEPLKIQKLSDVGQNVIQHSLFVGQQNGTNLFQKQNEQINEPTSQILQVPQKYIPIQALGHVQAQSFAQQTPTLQENVTIKTGQQSGRFVIQLPAFNSQFTTDNSSNQMVTKCSSANDLTTLQLINQLSMLKANRTQPQYPMVNTKPRTVPVVYQPNAIKLNSIQQDLKYVQNLYQTM